MQPSETARPGNSRLPAPDEDSARHSERVALHIRKTIEQAGGSVSFARFMHEALYAPGLGYYSAGARKFGAEGDFVTAPEVSELFGKVIAGQCAEVLAQMRGGEILEPGAGSGALAVTILKKLDELDCLPARYLILEVSADLRERQQALLEKQVPALADRVAWLTGLPAQFKGVVIANEVADALPVERFRKGENGFEEFRVGVEDEAFCWRTAPAHNVLEAALIDIEESLGQPFPEGFESEVSLGLQGWTGELVSGVEHGFVLLFDYGLSRREYYATSRSSGWLRCYFRHHAHENPLILPGIQDITAWVDFTSVAMAAEKHGMSVAGFLTQAHFLINGGLETELGNFTSLAVENQVKLSREVKLLTLPAEMGENFKCLGLGTTDIAAPSAFASDDRQAALQTGQAG